MSTSQQKIAADFEGTHWEWLIDSALNSVHKETGKKNSGLFTVING